MKIMKSFSFCYAHRVWNQVLSNNMLCKCRFIHGHLGKVDLEFITPVTYNGMVIDFNELKNIKTFIDSFIDHRFLVDVNDPLLDHYLKMLNCSLDDLQESSGKLKQINSHKLNTLCKELKEFGESLIVLNTVPTSEMLALWLSEVVRELIMEWTIQRQLKLVSLRWWEGDKSYAEWENV